MSTVHNPSEFKPQDYRVWEYLDNNPFSGPFCQATLEERAAWRQEMKATLGEKWQEIAYRCAHCGNTNVRWVVACQHTPTGEMLVFGKDCVHRLGFTDEKQFQLARLMSRDEARKVAVAAYLAREEFLKDKPELVAAMNDTANHDNFCKDVIGKLAKYGTLSEKQVAAVIKGVARFKERKATEATKPPAGPAPVGKVKVQGVVACTKFQASDFGDVHKMLVVFDNGSKAWGTVPSTLPTMDPNAPLKGSRVEFTADFTAKDGDPTFAFYKRPSKASVIEAAAAETAQP